jgi:hypothetical protein
VFPFTIQVYVNGHSWLAQQMLKRRLGFNLQDNAFTALEDPKAAQNLADSFATLNWTRILDRLIRDLHPLMKSDGSAGSVITQWPDGELEGLGFLL